LFAARGIKRLPQGLQKAPVFDISQLTARENGIIPLPKVQIGTNSLPKVQLLL